MENYLLLGEPILASLFAKPILVDAGFDIREAVTDNPMIQPCRIEESGVLSAFDSHDRDSEELCDLLSV